MAISYFTLFRFVRRCINKGNKFNLQQNINPIFTPHSSKGSAVGVRDVKHIYCKWQKRKRRAALHRIRRGSSNIIRARTPQSRILLGISASKKEAIWLSRVCVCVVYHIHMYIRISWHILSLSRIPSSAIKTMPIKYVHTKSNISKIHCRPLKLITPVFPLDFTPCARCARVCVFTAVADWSSAEPTNWYRFHYDIFFWFSLNFVSVDSHRRSVYFVQSTNQRRLTIYGTALCACGRRRCHSDWWLLAFDDQLRIETRSR